MTRTACYLLGTFLGAIGGASWGLGHQTQWVGAAPFMGLLIISTAAILLFAFISEGEWKP